MLRCHSLHTTRSARKRARLRKYSNIDRQLWKELTRHATMFATSSATHAGIVLSLCLRCNAVVYTKESPFFLIPVMQFTHVEVPAHHNQYCVKAHTCGHRTRRSITHQQHRPPLSRCTHPNVSVDGPARSHEPAACALVTRWEAPSVRAAAFTGIYATFAGMALTIAPITVFGEHWTVAPHDGSASLLCRARENVLGDNNN